MNAYEDMTGEDISSESKDAATNELVVTSELAGQLNDSDKAEQFLALIKEKVLSDDAKSESDIDPEQGFGFQRVYTLDGRIEEAYTVKYNDTVAIAEGYHPLCGAPGYQMYYLWTMTGRVNRGLISAKDPQHGWVK